MLGYFLRNSTVIKDNVLANVQKVQYSNDFVYINTHGIPAYPTGPFLDRNPSLASDQDAIFKIPLNPAKNTGTPTASTAGNIGVFVNGVALFDYRDGVSYSLSAAKDQGGPSGGRGDGVWNRDAVPAEMDGFDCSKGHPAMGNYHHHQNPSAFKLDQKVISTICNLYDADGLYSIDSTKHSPLIGFAYDGFPIYGAYGYANTDGKGGIARINSSYKLRSITARTHYADGSDVTDGPAVSTSFPLGHYREDYEYKSTNGHLDEHNGRFCVTPEYPKGIYAYFCTVDENWNSAYPYAVGPTFYGNWARRTVTTITETVETYSKDTTTSLNYQGIELKTNFSIFPNPAQDFVAVQASGLVENNIELELVTLKGEVVRSSTLKQGSTIWYIDTKTLYNGHYLLRIVQGQDISIKKVIIQK
tara:strand:- start:2042 stop:3289 length:1248 start_codon:yes stop_codon:yes gene_type:complete